MNEKAETYVAFTEYQRNDNNIVFYDDDNKITFSIMQDSDVDDSAILIGRTFSTCEGMCIVRDITVEEHTRFIRRFCERAVEIGTGMVAKNEKNKLVGAVVAFDLPFEAEVEKMDFGELNVDGEKYAPIMQFLGMMESHIPESLGDASKNLVIFNIAVTKEYNNRHIMRLLANLVHIAGTKNGFRNAIAVCTSPVSISSCNKYGYKQLYSYDYKDFEYKNEKVFAQLPAMGFVKCVLNYYNLE